MLKLRLTNGQEFEIAWIGVSNIDGVLRFSILNSDLARIIQIFTNPENCEVFTRIFDEDEQTYEGYTIFRGIQINYDGSAIVSMSKI